MPHMTLVYNAEMVLKSNKSGSCGIKRVCWMAKWPAPSGINPLFVIKPS